MMIEDAFIVAERLPPMPPMAILRYDAAAATYAAPLLPRHDAATKMPIELCCLLRECARCQRREAW